MLSRKTGLGSHTGEKQAKDAETLTTIRVASEYFNRQTKRNKNQKDQENDPPSV